MSEHVAETARCANCLYWRLQRPKEGLCQRRAPAAETGETVVAHWPQTHSEQWCGDHMPVGAATDLIHCVDCRYWRRPANGFEPTDHDDKLTVWWTRAGFCHRLAPEPSSDPGPRAFWPATHATDQCADAVRASLPTKMES